MTLCLNPECQQPQNPDDIEFCRACGIKLTPVLRNRYRIQRLIGQGGFGRTYLATDEDRLNSRCVVKQFSPQLQGAKSLEKAIKLFEQEAVRLHELGEHPQIPALLAYFEQDSRLYLVQQFVEGQTLLQELAQQGLFNEQKVREMLVGLLPLLKFIHDHQVIHRDITPSNIIRRKLDNKLVLIDFGVSKLLSAEASVQPGTKIGTEGYAPMEQLRGGKAYPASDLYSLAVTCVYLMTQVRPEDLYDPLEGRWLWRDVLRSRGQTVTDAIAQILDRMLKELVNERYQSADIVMRDLRAALGKPAMPATGGAAAAAAPPSRPPAPPSNPPAASPSGAVRPGSSGHPRVSGPISRPPISGVQGRRCLHTLIGHSQWVMAVAISPDGQMVVSGGLDATIRVWNLATGEPVRTLTGHTKPVNTLAIAPDGQTLVSGSDDDTIKIWQLSSGKLLRSLLGHSRDVNALAIYGNGEFLASGSEDRTVRVWRLSTGENLRIFSGQAGMVKSLAVSLDGQLLASGGLDNQIKLWRLNTGELVRTFIHFSSVNGVAFHPDGKTLVSGSKDKTIKVWNLANGELIRTLSGHTDAINAIALSPGGKLLVSGSSDTSIRLWNVDSGEAIATFNEHPTAVNAVAISSDGRCIASGSSDTTVKIWQIA